MIIDHDRSKVFIVSWLRSSQGDTASVSKQNGNSRKVLPFEEIVLRCNWQTLAIRRREIWCQHGAAATSRHHPSLQTVLRAHRCVYASVEHICQSQVDELSSFVASTRKFTWNPFLSNFTDCKMTQWEGIFRSSTGKFFITYWLIIDR